MKVAIMQPTFLPWLGYFDLIDRSDIFVLYDNVQLTKRSWQIRNRIKIAQGELLLTIPVKKSKHRNDLLICEAQINNEEKWKEKHLKSIQYAYNKSPYFHEVYEYVKAHYNKDWKLLVEFNIELILAISALIGIDINFVRSSSLEGIIGIKDARLLSICRTLKISKYISPQGSADYIEEYQEGGLLGEAGIEVYYHSYQHPMYPQKFEGFLAYCGILDLLFNVGFDASLDIIRSGRRKLITSSVYRKEYLNK